MLTKTSFFLPILAFSLSVACADTRPAPDIKAEERPQLEANPHSESKTHLLFDSQRDSCDGQDAPDAPARAFKDNTGKVHLFVSGTDGRANVGDNLLSTIRNCSKTYSSHRLGDPAAYADYEWLAAFYTDDGQHVAALIHEEFHGAERPGLCPDKNSSGCTQTAITEAFSVDGGKTFTHTAGGGELVAALPKRFEPTGQTVWTGFMNPTNIISYKGFEYFFVSFITPSSTSPAAPRQSGVCLLRSTTPFQAESWRAWDGNSFSIKFTDPYQTSVPSPSILPCAPIGANVIFNSLGSLSWYEPSQLFVLVTRCQKWNKDCSPGAYLSTSPDLIHWSKSKSILSDREASPGGAAQWYPSLLDPTSHDRNYADISDAPWLITVQMEMQGNKLDRKIMMFHLDLSDALRAAALQ